MKWRHQNPSIEVSMKHVSGLLVFGLVGIVASSSCTDSITEPVVSSLDGAALNAAVMAKLRDGGQGCAFSIIDPTDRHNFQDRYLHGNKVPFNLPKLSRNENGGPGSGRSIEFEVKNQTIPEPILVSCWVPATVSETQLLLLTTAVDWKEMYARLRRSKSFSLRELDRPISREVQQFRYELIGTAPSVVSATGPKATMASFVDCSVTGRQMAAGPTRATPEIITEILCHCVGDPTVNAEGEEMWSNLFCEYHIGFSQGGETSTWYNFPAAQPKDRATVASELEASYCGAAGCLNDNSQGYGGMTLGLSGSSMFIDGPSTVTFEASAGGGSVTSVSWQWISAGIGGGYTTASNCPRVPDQWNCNIEVNQPGRLEVSIEGENGAWAWAFSEVNMALPGAGNDHSGPPVEPTCSGGKPTNVAASEAGYPLAMAWCQGEPLDTTKTNHKAAKAKLDSAFAVIRGRTGFCVTIADKLQEVMEAGKFRFIVLPFDTTGTISLPYGFDAFAEGGSHPYWAISINTVLAGGIIARQDLAHEGDHLLDQYDPNGIQTDQAGHLKDGFGKVNPRKTLHSDACSASG